MKDMPLYKTIYEDLKRKITDGTYSENEALPSERALCEMYHVSKSTLRQALVELSHNNYIVKSWGNGNFVKPRMYERKMAKFQSFVESLKDQSVQIKNKIIGYELVTKDKYLDSLTLNPLQLNISGNLSWHKLTRLRSDEDFPLLVETSYLPQWRFFELNTDILGDGSLYAYLRKFYNMEITDANEFLSPVMPNKKERDLLQIPEHNPCMLDELFCYENDNLIAIHCSTVRGDKFKFQSSSYING